MSLDYISSSIDILDKCPEKITFSVFVKLGNDKFVQIFSPDSGLDYLRLQKYKTKVSLIFFLASEKKAVEDLLTISLDSFSTNESIPLSNETIQKKNEIVLKLENLTRENLEKILVPKVSDVEIKETKAIVLTYVSVLARDPDVVFNILQGISESDYLSFHLTATSMLSIFICRLLKQYGKRLQEIVGLGGYLHDIGKVKLIDGFDLSTYRDELIPKNELRRHPEIGMEMLRHSKVVPEEVRQIIYQHHEEPSGKGYPRGLKNPMIYFPASIISIANDFSKLIAPKPYGLEFSSREAIRKLLDEDQKYNKHIIKPLTTLYKV